MRVHARASLLLLAVLLACMAAQHAYAASQLQLTTYFTGVKVKPGDVVTETLHLRSNASSPIEVSLGVEAPSGWRVTLKNMGYTVSRVMVEPGETRSIDVTIRVPMEAKPGTYTVKIRAEGPCSSAELAITVQVEPRPAAGPITVRVSYPSLTGSPGSKLDFTFDIKNNLDRDVTVSLGVVEAPPGWRIVFRPYTYSTTVISGLTVKAASTQYGVVAETYIPNSVTPGKYRIIVSATAEGHTVKIPLVAEVSGIVSYRLSTPSGLLSFDVTAGSSRNVTIVVENTGTEPLTGITLSSLPPAGWRVEFEPRNITMLQPGQSVSVTMTVKPPAGALAGDYMLTVSAYHAKAGSKNLDFRVTVVKQTYWGIIGVVVVVVAVAALLIVFWRFGRP